VALLPQQGRRVRARFLVFLFEATEDLDFLKTVEFPMETTSPPINLTLISTLSGHLDRCWHLSLHSTLPLLSSSSTDQTVNIYDTSTSSLVTTLKGQHSRSIRASSWKPSTQPVLATASFDGSAGIWHPECEDGEESGEWECVATLEGHENECKCVAWSFDGRYLATCSRDKSVWVWEGNNFFFLCQLMRGGV
jgi:WD40 repeat protein